MCVCVCVCINNYHKKKNRILLTNDIEFVKCLVTYLWEYTNSIEKSYLGQEGIHGGRNKATGPQRIK